MKYIIFDFGGVLVYPTTGNWHITPRFLELIDMDKLNKEKAIANVKKYQNLIDCSLLIRNKEEEYNAMKNFYDKVLSDSYEDYKKEISEEIAKDRVYNFDKYKLYDDVIDELKRLSRDYKLILLSDNWPSVFDYLKHFKLDQYFDKIFISSIYGTKKEDGTFFDVMLHDYDITESNAVFIDDHKENLEVAKTKGISVLLIDRNNKKIESNYIVINSLSEICKKEGKIL